RDRSAAFPARPRSALQRPEKLADAFLRRAVEALVHSRLLRPIKLPRPEHVVELEPAGLDERTQGLERRLHRVRLPAGDLSAVAADTGAELGLGQTRSRSRLTNDRSARHGLSLTGAWDVRHG